MSDAYRAYAREYKRERGHPPPEGTQFIHWCYDWDYMLICEHDQEFMECSCFCDDPAARQARRMRRAEFHANYGDAR